MFEPTIRRNIVIISIIIYLLIYYLCIKLKPGFLYTRDGSLRSFGLGYKNKTVIPGWVLVTFISILVYFSLMHYVRVDEYAA